MIKFSFKGFSRGSIFKAYSQTYNYKLNPTPVFPIVEESTSSPGYPLEGHTKRKQTIGFRWIMVQVLALQLTSLIILFLILIVGRNNTHFWDFFLFLEVLEFEFRALYLLAGTISREPHQSSFGF
jgi:hypothetical protein